MNITQLYNEKDCYKIENVEEVMMELLWIGNGRSWLAKSFCVDCGDDVYEKSEEELYICGPGEEFIHLIFTFNENEVPTSEDAYELADKFCRLCLGNKNIIFSVHDIDEIPHIHIVMRNFSGKKFDLMSPNMYDIFDSMMCQLEKCKVNCIELDDYVDIEEMM